MRKSAGLDMEVSMKKYVGILLLISLATSVPMQAQIQEQIKARWNSLKSHFDREVKEFNRCVIERRKDCDPLRKNIYITAGILLTLLTVWGVKKGVKQYERMEYSHLVQPEPPFQPKKPGWLKEETEEIKKKQMQRQEKEQRQAEEKERKREAEQALSSLKQSEQIRQLRSIKQEGSDSDDDSESEYESAED